MRTTPGTHSILFWLRLLVLACVLPGWAVTTWLIVASGLRERSAREQSTVETARALTQALDRELASSIMGLQALATSRFLAEGDLAAFQRQAVEALPNLAGRNIVLADPSGQELINTSKGYGNPLPRIAGGGARSFEAVFRTGKPTISDLFTGSLSHRPIVAIGAPVIVDGKVAYCLSLGIAPERLAEIIRRQDFRSGWIAAIVDSTGTFVARTRNEEQFIGKKMAPPLLSKIADVNEGIFEGITQDGISAVVGFSRSTVSGWTVGIGISTAELMAPLYRSLWLTISAAASLLLLALLIAWIIGARIARTIRSLSGPALALAADTPVLVPPLAIREVNEVGGTLAKASHLLREHRIARERVEQEALRESNAKLAAENKAMARFDEAGLRLWHATSLREGLNATLEGTIDLVSADMGAIHLLDSESNLLQMVAHRGLKQEYLDHFREVPAELGLVGEAMLSGTPLVMEDTELDSSSTQVRLVRRAADYRAFVLAPLTDSRGKRLGMVSIHFHSPHRPNASEMRWLQLYQRRAADFILRFRARDALGASEERLRLALEAGHMATWDSDARTGVHVWNDEFYRLFGYQIGEVQPSHDAWARRIHPDDRAAAESLVANANREHKDYVNEFRLLRPDGSVRWIRARGRFIFYDGEPVRTIGLVEDVTEARQQIETQRVLVAELQHRTRNLMAVVQSIAHQTLDAVDSVVEFEGRFSRRLEALSRVQSLLSRADNEPITLGALIGMEFEALSVGASRDRIKFGGPEVALRKSAVEMLALAIHELLTNAIKYGALASPTGRLSVNWRTDGTLADSRLVLEWNECGIEVPLVDPIGSGYGRTLIEEALPYSLSARTKFQLNPDSLHCVISLPLAANEDDEHSARSVR